MKNTITTTKDIVRRLGGPVQVAGAIGVTHSAVCQWTKIPAEYVPTLVALSRKLDDPMTAADLRPDVPWEKLSI